MCLYEMYKAGILTSTEYDICSRYTDLTDVIITYDNGIFRISTREETIKHNNKPDFIRDVKELLYWVIDALKAMYSDREEDGRQADRD